MTDSVFAWPALQPVAGESFGSGEIEAQRAVLGKVHRAASDFRWIARSPGFETGSRPEAETSTGLENLPLDGGLWRSTEQCCYAVRCYKSRALDQAGRSTALEKQFLARKPDAHLPRTLIALLLLQRVEGYDDTIWWDRRSLEDWRNPSYSLQLEPVRIAWDAERLLQAVAQSIARLRESCSEQEAARFYARLLAGTRPALLGRHFPTLGRLSFAADHVSLAGWIFSSRYDPQSIARRWDAVACQRRPAQFPENDKNPSEEHKRLADNWAQALWEDDLRSIFQPRPATAVESQKPSEDDLSKAIRMVDKGAGWTEVEPFLARVPVPIRLLVKFSLQPQTWWLTPKQLVRNGDRLHALSPQGLEAQLLSACLKRVEMETPGSSSPEGWRIKADLLRAACLSLSTHPQTLQRVGWPQSPLVPPLLFVTLLDPSERGALQQLGPLLEESRQRSNECPYEELLEPIESFFRE